MTSEQSNKHSPRIDEALEHQSQSFLQGSPVDSRVREDLREHNGPRPGQASADASAGHSDPGTSEGLTPEEVARRAELATYIQPSVFPAQKDLLLESARHEQAPAGVISLLDTLPEDHEFNRLEEVWEAVSQ